MSEVPLKWSLSHALGTLDGRWRRARSRAHREGAIGEMCGYLGARGTYWGTVLSKFNEDRKLRDARGLHMGTSLIRNCPPPPRTTVGPWVMGLHVR